MECPVDPNMSIVGVTHAKWYGAPGNLRLLMSVVKHSDAMPYTRSLYVHPGPMFCGPKTDEQPFSGFWDHLYECTNLLLNECM